jgi:GNAT superfamily N-acetyltransferase
VKRCERGRGIGTKLGERVQEELAALGCTVLISDAWHDAEEFYESLGFREPDVKLLRKKLDK